MLRRDWLQFAVSFVKPGDDDGHPGYSTLAAFEGLVTHVVDEVQNNSALWKSTAIFVTLDEGGGYYDSGPVQATSFFGDGTRVPMLAISPYTRAGYVDHSSSDHVSLLKFTEAKLETVTADRQQPRQPARPGAERRFLPSERRAGNQRPDGTVRLPSAPSIGAPPPVGPAPVGQSQRRRDSSGARPVEDL